MTISLIAIVVRYSDAINNGRTRETVMESIKSEVDELEEEVQLKEQGFLQGPDGIFGECVDVIASVVDLIRMERPDLSVEQLEVEVAQYLDLKCQKWARKYS